VCVCSLLSNFVFLFVLFICFFEINTSFNEFRFFLVHQNRKDLFFVDLFICFCVYGCCLLSVFLHLISGILTPPFSFSNVCFRLLAAGAFQVIA
jgi:hypothetical protein